jgi:hypothetical protein
VSRLQQGQCCHASMQLSLIAIHAFSSVALVHCSKTLRAAASLVAYSCHAGTITVGDIQVVTVAALDGLAIGTSVAENLSHKYDLKARPHALHVVRAWAAKGYQPIYLSGRQVSSLVL